MKKIKKMMIPLLIGGVFLIVASNYTYLQITPRVLGESAFPLKEKWKSCVNKKIKDVSANNQGEIFVKTSTSLNVYDRDTGISLWHSPIRNLGESFPAVGTDEKVFASDDEYLWAFDLDNGKTLWKVNHENTYTWIPDVSEKFVILNTISGLVEIFDASSGDKLWGILGGRGFTQAYIDNDKIYIVDRGIKALEAQTGKLLWELDDYRATDISIFSNGVLYYTEYPGDDTYDLVALNTNTISELWRINFVNNNPSDTALSSLYIHENFLFMTQRSVIYRLNPENGKTLWKKGFYEPADLSLIEDKVYVYNPLSETIQALDVENGIDLGLLQIAFYQIDGIDSQRVTSIGERLVFTRGCEIFVYGE